MEYAVPEACENRPVWPVRPFARRTASFALIFESLEIGDRVCPMMRRYWLGCDRWRFSAWMPVADVEGARDHHRQTAVCRLLKNRGRVFCRGGLVRSHTPSVDSCVTGECSQRYSHPTHLESTVEPIWPCQSESNDHA
jgi:hypothetical protein